MAQGLLSKGIKFEYSTNGTAYTEVKNLQEILQFFQEKTIIINQSQIV